MFVLFVCIVSKIYEHSTCLLFGMTSCTFCWGRRLCYKNDHKQTFVKQREKGPGSDSKPTPLASDPEKEEGLSLTPLSQF